MPNVELHERGHVDLAQRCENKVGVKQMWLSIKQLLSCLGPFSMRMALSETCLQIIQLQAQREDLSRGAVGLLPCALRQRFCRALSRHGRVALDAGLLQRRQQLTGILLTRQDSGELTGWRRVWTDKITTRWRLRDTNCEAQRSSSSTDVRID